MPHGMQPNTMAIEISPLQAEGLLEDGKASFIYQLECFKEEDIECYREDFGARIPSEVWRDTKFWVSTKGHVRALQPNNIVMVWSHDERSWMDNDHDE